MKFNPAIHYRRSIRLKGYDYYWVGAYFVTLCCEGRNCLFGKVIDGDMHHEQDCLRISEYIRTNPARWAEDKLHPMPPFP